MHGKEMQESKSMKTKALKGFKPKREGKKERVRMSKNGE